MFSTQQLALFIGSAIATGAIAASPEYVVSISVDGLGSTYAQPMLDNLPNLKRMFTEGAGTFNARTDAGVAVTLPNHVGMVTGRPMNNYSSPLISGHGWSSNGDPAVGQTIHTNKGSYVASVFDVAHDNGKSTAMWSGKSKFSLFDTSYNATNGAAAANGKDKLDYAYVNNGVSAATLTSDFLGKMASSPYSFSFVHYQDPDAAGHASGWGSTAYNNSLKSVDTQIGNILSAIQNSPILKGKTAVILTADHGGHSTTHGDTADLRDTQIPFVVWGAGVTAGDLYGMNTGVLLDPALTNPGYAGLQPIRNGNVANLALDLMDLGPVPGSTIGYAQTIAVPEPAGVAIVGLMSAMLMRRKRRAVA